MIIKLRMHIKKMDFLNFLPAHNKTFKVNKIQPKRLAEPNNATHKLPTKRFAKKILCRKK